MDDYVKEKNYYRSISQRPKICSLALYKIRKRIVRARNEPILDLILLAVKNYGKSYVLVDLWYLYLPTLGRASLL